MSEILELLFNVFGWVLEIVAEVWLGGFARSDTTASRIFWCIMVLLLSGLIWWELR